MSIFQVKRTSIYLTVDANAKPIRPLAEKTVSMWVNMIPSCSIVSPAGQKTILRHFRQVSAGNQVYGSWFKNNLDPLWDKLTDNDKFNKDNKRQDFAIRLQHILPVWSYADNDVKIVKQGNQFFEEMDKFDDAGNVITTCDWMAWTVGKGRQTQYKTLRQDARQFECQIAMDLLKQKVQAAMEQALADLNPFKDFAEMIQFVTGQSAQDAGAFPNGAGAPTQVQGPVQQALPPYTPGGQTNVALGSPPVLQQPTQPYQYQPPQQAVPQYQAPQQPQYQAPQQPQYQAPQQPQYQAPQYPGQAPYSPQPVIQPPYVPQPVQSSVPPYQYQPPQQAVPQYQAPQHPIQQPETVPNAPIVSAPVFAPPVQTQQPQISPQVLTGNPADVQVTSGKFAGKTLGWIKDNEPGYLSYLKANKRELAPAIEALLISSPVSAAPVTPAQQVASHDEDPAMKNQLVREINEKILKVQEFQGPGIQKNMIPFVKHFTGTTNWSEAPVDQLQAMKTAIDQKLGLTA